MKKPTVTPLYAHQHTLGEGAFWEHEQGQIWWVDIIEKRIYCSDAAGQELRVWTMPELVGFALPRPDGRFWVGLQSGLHIAELLAHGESRLERVDNLVHPAGDVRFNDGCLSPDGSLYASTMAMDSKSVLGAVVHYKADGSKTRIADGFVVGNGPLWHPQLGLLMVETVGHAHRQKGIYLHQPMLSDAPDPLWLKWEWECLPDGISVDSAGTIWVGGYGGHTIRQFSPEGKLLRAIDLPALNPTKIAALPDGRLFVTTASENVSDEQLEQFPMTGQVLLVSDFL